ncbi:LOC100170577 protein-like protein, partial [Pelagophyceae sp. CCMP2097]
AATMAAPISSAIASKLTAALSPSFLDVINESGAHNVPPGSETHFRVVIVSAQFQGLKLLARHRAVQALLELELKTGVHALSITAKTPEEWAAKSTVAQSPPCLGGGAQ